MKFRLVLTDHDFLPQLAQIPLEGFQDCLGAGVGHLISFALQHMVRALA